MQALQGIFKNLVVAVKKDAFKRPFLFQHAVGWASFPDCTNIPGRALINDPGKVCLIHGWGFSRLRS